jgi:hypothetical protein
MSWKYRVMELDDEFEGKYYEIKEVYYNRDGSPMGFCDAVVSGGSIEELIKVLDMMKEDAHMAVVKPEDFKGPVYEDTN